MQLVIRGLENQVVCKDLSGELVTLELVKQLALENGLENGSFKLVVAGQELDNTMTLNQNGLVCGSILDLALEVDGGKKKKKKKVYKTEKKKKHKHINTPMRVKSYYNIKGDGTVEAIKFKNPVTTEGKVTYMADHWNRFYCGKTHVTFIKDKPSPQKKKAEKKVEAKVDPKAKAAPAKGKVKGKK